MLKFITRLFYVLLSIIFATVGIAYADGNGDNKENKSFETHSYSHSFWEIIDDPVNNTVEKNQNPTIVYSVRDENGDMVVSDSIRDNFKSRMPNEDLYIYVYPPREYDPRIFDFLCDEENIYEYFHENGIYDFDEIIIIDQYQIIDGFIVYARGSENAYFITLPINRDNYGEFKFKQIYTGAEFTALCNAWHEGELYFNGELVECDVKPHVRLGYAWVPLRAAFEAMGIEVVWNEEDRSVTIGEIKIFTIDDPEAYTYPNNYLRIECKDGKRFNEGIFVDEIKFVDGRLLVNDYFFTALGWKFGYTHNVNSDIYSVMIYKR